MSLSSSTLSPNLPVLEQANCPPAHKQNTLTQAHTVAHTVAWDMEPKKRVPERFLKVELLKAWMAASAFKLLEPLSC